MRNAILVLLMLMLASTSMAQLDEKMEEELLERLRRRFERDVGDLQELLKQRGDVDQFLQQRSQGLFEDIAQGVDQEDRYYKIVEEKTRYVIRPLSAIDSNIPCKIEINEKSVSLKGTLLAPIGQAVDISIAVPPDGDAKRAKVNLDKQGMVEIIIPKVSEPRHSP